MAEVKNAFIKSKMNKDLDDRLIPNGEYRDAQNVQISKSQGPDVGALESVYGNELIKNFASALKTPAATVDPNIKCIGNFVDDFNNIYKLKRGIKISYESDKKKKYFIMFIWVFTDRI